MGVKGHEISKSDIAFSLGKGLLLAYMISLVIFGIAALLLTFTKMSEAIIPALVVFTSIGSISIGGASVARSIRGKGWLYGGLLGILFVFILIVLGTLLIPGFQYKGSILVNSLIGFVVGGIGGIIGINL